MKAVQDIAALYAFAEKAGLAAAVEPTVNLARAALRSTLFVHIQAQENDGTLYCFVCEEVVENTVYARIIDTNVGPRPICVHCQPFTPPDVDCY